MTAAPGRDRPAKGRTGLMKSLILMWVLSLLAALGMGWLAFSTPRSAPVVHALFLLSVGVFVASSIWTLARGLSTLRDHARADRTTRLEPHASEAQDRVDAGVGATGVEAQDRPSARARPE